MNCSEIRNIIITDYVDNELDAKTRQQIEIHLSHCSECRSFADNVMISAVLPLRNNKKITPPDIIWQNIKSKVKQNNSAGGDFSKINIFSFFRPQWVNIAAVISMILFTSLAGNFFVKKSGFLQQNQTELIELAENIGFGEFYDMPNEQIEKAYTNIVGG